MTTLAGRPRTALLVIDAQNGVVGDAHQRDRVVANIAVLVDKARAEQVPVVWVAHSDEGGMPRGSQAWQYVDELRRNGSEPLVHRPSPTRSRTPTSRRFSPASRSAGSSSPARRPTSASGPPCTGRSPGATTRP